MGRAQDFVYISTSPAFTNVKGKAKRMKSSTQNKAEGTAKNIAGRVKEVTGKAVGNPRLQADGKAEKVEGKVQTETDRKETGFSGGSDPGGVVEEVFQGKAVWTGDVEVFALTGCERSNRCYAWGLPDECGTLEIAAVLAIPPVDSAAMAVRVAIASGARHQSG